MCQRVARIYLKGHLNSSWQARSCFDGDQHSSLIFRISRYRSIPWLLSPAALLTEVVYNNKESTQTKGDSRGIPLVACVATSSAVGFTVMSWCTNRCSRTYSGNSSPDKEFRYLRTVRVTAAVYWTFSLELS